MKQKAKCTYCISQVMNTYPDRRKNPMPQGHDECYIEVDTETEADYIETMNYHMQAALLILQDLRYYIETQKP